MQFNSRNNKAKLTVAEQRHMKATRDLLYRLARVADLDTEPQKNASIGTAALDNLIRMGAEIDLSPEPSVPMEPETPRKRA